MKLVWVLLFCSVTQASIYDRDEMMTTLRERALHTRRMSQLSIGLHQYRLSYKTKRMLVRFFLDFIILEDFVQNYPDIPKPPQHISQPDILDFASPWPGDEVRISHDRALMIKGLSMTFSKSAHALIEAMGKERLPRQTRIQLMRSILGRMDARMDLNELKLEVRQAFNRAQKEREYHSKRVHFGVGVAAFSLLAVAAITAPMLSVFPHLDIDPTGALDFIAIQAAIFSPVMYVLLNEGKIEDLQKTCDEFWQTDD